MEQHYSRVKLNNLSYTAVQTICVNIGACENRARITKVKLINKILAHQKPSKKVVKTSKSTTKTSRKTKARKPKAKTSKAKTSRKLVSPEKSETKAELGKLKVAELNAIIKREKITLPKKRMDGKAGNLLKADKVRAIYDSRSRGSTKESVTPKKVVKKTKAKKVVKKTVKKPAAKKVVKETKAELGKLKVAELNAIIKREKITLPKKRMDGKAGNLLKADKVRAIYDSRSRGSTKESVTPKKVVKETKAKKTARKAPAKKTARKAPAKKTARKAPAKKTSKPKYPCYRNGVRKCKKPTEWCDTKTGKCNASQEGPSSYTYDSLTGLIGPKAEIDNYKKYLKSIGKLPKTKTPPKAKKDTPRKKVRTISRTADIKARRAQFKKDKEKVKKMTKAELKKHCEETYGVEFNCNLTKKELLAVYDGVYKPSKIPTRCDDKENYISCLDDEICGEEGNCIDDSDANRVGKWTLSDTGRGYDIVGSKSHIEQLLKLLGEGSIRKPERVSKKKMTKARKQLGKSVQESVDIDPEQAKIIKTFTECLEGLRK